MVNYYQVLGLPFGVAVEQVRKAYREYAKHFHPDKHPLNTEFFTERFKDVQQAYEILCDDKTRRQFEQDFTNHKNSNAENILRRELNEENVKYYIQAIKLSEVDAQLKRLVSENAELRKGGKAQSNTYGRIASYVRSNLTTGLRWSFVSILPLFFLYKCFGPKKGIDIRKEWDSLHELIDKEKFAQAATRTDSLLKSGQIVIPSTTQSKTGTHLTMADILVVRGYAKYRLENDTGAMKDYTTVAQNGGCSNDARLFNLRANLKLKLGNTTGALLDYGTSIGGYPKSHRSYQDRANLFYNRKEYAKALPDYRAATLIQPRDGDLINNFANCYHAMGKVDSACVIWRRAGELGSGSAYQNIKNFCH